MLLDCGSLRASQVPFLPAAAGTAALIIDTRVTHALVSGDYAARRAECEEAARLLRSAPLGSVTGLGRLSEIGDPVLRRRARHVITDCARARAMAAALLADDYADRGGAEPTGRRGGPRSATPTRTVISGNRSSRATPGWGRLRGLLAGGRRGGGGRDGGGCVRREDDRRRLRRLGPRARSGGPGPRGPRRADRGLRGARLDPAEDCIGAVPSPAARRLPPRFIRWGSRAPWSTLVP